MLLQQQVVFFQFVLIGSGSAAPTTSPDLSVCAIPISTVLLESPSSLFSVTLAAGGELPITTLTHSSGSSTVASTAGLVSSSNLAPSVFKPVVHPIFPSAVHHTFSVVTPIVSPTVSMATPAACTSSGAMSTVNTTYIVCCYISCWIHIPSLHCTINSHISSEAYSVSTSCCSCSCSVNFFHFEFYTIGHLPAVISTGEVPMPIMICHVLRILCGQFSILSYNVVVSAQYCIASCVICYEPCIITINF